MKACLRGQTLLYSLSYKLLFYLTNSQARNKQNRPRKLWVHACVYMCLCVCVHVLACLCVFVCSGKSGVWIMSSCLSDRKASSVKQRGRQHQSVLCLISAALHIPSNTEVHTGLCRLGLYVLTQTVFAALCTTNMNQTPIWSFQWNFSVAAPLVTVGWQDRCIFTQQSLLVRL